MIVNEVPEVGQDGRMSDGLLINLHTHLEGGRVRASTAANWRRLGTAWSTSIWQVTSRGVLSRKEPRHQ